MLSFPLHNAALDLKGKPPAELPHGLLPIPPAVREIVEMQRAKLAPEVFGGSRIPSLNLETLGWYFYDLDVPVIYRETSEGPEVLAVGREEVRAYDNRFLNQPRPDGVKAYRGFL